MSWTLFSAALSKAPLNFGVMPHSTEMIGLLRLVVVLATVSWALAWFLPLFPFAAYSDTYFDASMLSGSGAFPLFTHPIYVWGYPFIWLVAAAAVILLRSWGRSLYLGLAVFDVLVAPFSGLSVNTGLENALLNAALTLDGAAICLAYFSSASKHFEGNEA